MIKSLDIKNFKSLLDVHMELGNFNLLSGTNSSGKTSIIHSLLCLSQNANDRKNATLNGRLVKLGRFEDVKNFDKPLSEKIEISGVQSNDKLFKLILEFNPDSKYSVKLNSKENIEYFKYEKSLYYLSANRIGIADVHETGSEEEHFGQNGEFTVDYLNRNREELISEEYVHDKERDEAKNLFNEVDYWLNRITNTKIKAKDLEDTSKSVVTFSQGENQHFVRSLHTGSGISYLISILITCFGVSIISKNTGNEPILVIENPEIHLHPRAQSVLTEFLIFMSRRIQIVVETQSDHIFNRFRREIYAKRLEKNKILRDLGSVHFMKYVDNMSIVTPIEFSSDGRVMNHQTDLFEQFDIDIMELLG